MPTSDLGPQKGLALHVAEKGSQEEAQSPEKSNRTQLLQLHPFGNGAGTQPPLLSWPTSPAAAHSLPVDPGERTHQGGEQRGRQQAHHPCHVPGALRLLHTAGGEQAGQQAGPGQPDSGR